MRIMVPTAFLLLLLLPMGFLAEARGPAAVANTIHNLSSTGVDPWVGTPGSSQYASNEDEICVFCHTPHGGSLQGPLWNRNDPVQTWSHYTSTTLSTFGGLADTARAVSRESLICLSCHDGSISVYSMINKSNTAPDPIESINTFAQDVRVNEMWGSTPVVGPGGDLRDDHPISFSYQTVYGNPPYSTGSKVGQLRDPAQAITYAGEGVQFFGADQRVECSSCHDPHVDYMANSAYAPFLIMPNTGSNLCFACHVK